MIKPYRWQKIRRSHTAANTETIDAALDFFKKREKYCVAACAHLLCRQNRQKHIWYLPDAQAQVLAVLLHSKRSLFPLFDGNRSTPIPRFMDRFLRTIHFHSIQGQMQDVEILESAVGNLGYTPQDTINYHLMIMDGEPYRTTGGIKKGPPGLIVRKPDPHEIDAIFPLQAAYEIEEVLPKGAEFYPPSCRKNLEQVMEGEQMLVACLANRIVGKINTSAASFSRYQIGGVYVHPDYRGLGIAQCMTFALVRLLSAQCRGLSLFVKKRNQAALRVYSRVGFEIAGDYRISYY
ncbi:MAG: GNAT family N-acetyltransferase [Treponema sp.]|jgi:ribosomal protein S18 acetylase RimI-like enzyme|nr:GNAT family N-acetyltransferase [Treponema sp.]